MQNSIADLQSQIAALLAAAPGNSAPRLRPTPQRIPLSGLTNALTGQDMFLEEHEYPAYMHLGAQYSAELRPVGVRETQLAQKIIDINWRLNTLSVIENNLFHSSRLDHIAPNDPSSDQVIGMTSKAATWRADCEGANAFEKLGRHESRVQRNLFRIIAEFERFQSLRLKNGPDTFVLAECQAWIWYDHMLALHTQLAAQRRADAEALTSSDPITSEPELLCKKPSRAERHAAAAFAETAAPILKYAAANGLLSPEHREILDRYNLAP